jgi:hypothetical protein
VAIAELVVQVGASVFRQFLPHPRMGHGGFGLGQRRRPLCAFFGETRLVRRQGSPLSGHPGLEEVVGMLDSQLPQPCHRLPRFRRQFRKLQDILEAFRQTAAPRVQHPRDGVWRAGTHGGPDFFHSWLVAGGDQRVGGGVDLLLSDTTRHESVSLIGALPWTARIGDALSPAAVGAIVQRRAAKAGLKGSFGGHSLRSGFITEGARQGVALPALMAMTEHRSVASVIGYFQAGGVTDNPAARLLEDAETVGGESGR